MPRAQKTQTDKPRRYHAEFRLTESWRFRNDNPDSNRYQANYESKFKPGTDEHTIDFWEEVLNCFGPKVTPYEEKIRLYRKDDENLTLPKSFDDDVADENDDSDGMTVPYDCSDEEAAMSIS